MTDIIANGKRVVRSKIIECKSCGVTVATQWPRQFYCEACSDRKNEKRKGHEKVKRDANRIAGDRWKAVGIERSREHAEAFAFYEPELAWVVKVAVPFSYKASKNAIYTSRPNSGHRALRRAAKEWRDALTLLLSRALKDSGKHVKHNKIWLDIFVQKENHRGDAVNVVDLVCDAVKVAAGVDDRWFCIRRVDWQVVKDNPRIFVGIGQEDCEDAQVCSCCGDIKTLEHFTMKKGNAMGVDRVCRGCRSASRVPRSQAAQDATDARVCVSTWGQG